MLNLIETYLNSKPAALDETKMSASYFRARTTFITFYYIIGSFNHQHTKTCTKRKARYADLIQHNHGSVDPIKIKNIDNQTSCSTERKQTNQHVIYVSKSNCK